MEKHIAAINAEVLGRRGVQVLKVLAVFVAKSKPQ
jgi:hypothetical protein